MTPSIGVPFKLRDGRRAVISAARESDAAALIEHMELVGGETDFLSFGAGELRITVEQQARYLAAFADPANGLMLKAEVEGELAATASMKRVTRPRLQHVGVLGIAVARFCWGAGLGRHLCEVIIAESRRIGVRKVELRVRSDNDRAIQLYVSLGFVVEGTVTGALCIDGRYYDDLAMALWIG